MRLIKRRYVRRSARRLSSTWQTGLPPSAKSLPTPATVCHHLPRPVSFQRAIDSPRRGIDRSLMLGGSSPGDHLRLRCAGRDSSSVGNGRLRLSHQRSLQKSLRLICPGQAIVVINGQTHDRSCNLIGYAAADPVEWRRLVRFKNGHQMASRGPPPLSPSATGAIRPAAQIDCVASQPGQFIDSNCGTRVP